MTISNCTIISGQNICLRIGCRVILKSVDIDIKDNNVTVITGPNGGGKTSLLRVLSGIIKPMSGNVVKRKNLVIGYIPQKIHISSMMPISVYGFINLNNACKDLEKKQEILKIVNIDHLMNKKLHYLSGGEMQYVLLARAMMKNPDVLIMDEPTSNMDVIAKKNFYETLVKIKDISECSIVYSSHDFPHLFRCADYMFCVNKKICCHGCPKDVDFSDSLMSNFVG